MPGPYSAQRDEIEMKSRAVAVQAKKSRFTFIGETLSELRKVVWPTRREAIRLSIMVAAICMFVGLVLGVIDYGFSELVSKVFLGLK